MNPQCVTFFVWAPDYTQRHSGIVCLHLLCHHLNRLGYRSCITGRGSPPNLRVNLADQDELQRLTPQDIVIYPEIVRGNPLKGKRVVRYLLNKPGRAGKATFEDYGKDDYFLHFADEFRPEGVASRLLWIPLVDKSIYCPESQLEPRKGFVLFSHRRELDPEPLPDWVAPITRVSWREPRTPPELAKLYRESRALIVGERTAAINEAIHCGCPVILMPGKAFDHGRILKWYFGCGATVGWNQQGLARAGRTVPIAKLIYRLRGLTLDRRIHRFASDALKYFASVT